MLCVAFFFILIRSFLLIVVVVVTYVRRDGYVCNNRFVVKTKTKRYGMNLVCSRILGESSERQVLCVVEGLIWPILSYVSSLSLFFSLNFVFLGYRNVVLNLTN